MVRTRSQQGEGEREAPAAPAIESGPRATAQPELRPDPRLLALREEMRESPLSPSPETVELDTSAFRRRLDEHLQRAEQRARERVPQLPAEDMFSRIRLDRDYREPLSGEPSTQREHSGDRVAFSEEVRVRAPASVHSRLSADTEARIREAERQAAEQLAQIEQRKLELEQEAIRRRLEATKEQIIEEGSRAGGSIADPTQRVGRWLDDVPLNPATPTRRHGASLNERAHSPRRHRTRSPDPTRPTDTTSPRDRSSSKSRGIERLAEHLESMMRPPPRQVYELPAYSGEAHEWQTFMHAYQQSTTRYKFSNYENVARLRHCLRGEARQCVQHLLASSSSPDLIVRVLKKNFGRTDLLIDRAIDELRRLPAVGPSATDLNTFAIRIVNIVSTLVDLDTRSYSANPLIIREITDRLSPHLRSRWCAYAKANIAPGRSELMLIAEFLMEESDMELEFSHARAPVKKYTERAVTARTTREPRRAEPRTFGTGGGAPATAGAGGAYRKPPAARTQTYAIERVDACLCCGNGHRTTNCVKMQNMHVGDRWKWARDNRICYKCLSSKHRKENCKARGCNVAGCPHQHHPLLHEARGGPVATSDTRAPPRSTARQPSPTEHEQTDRSTGDRPPSESRVFAADVTDNNPRSETTVLLKVVPVIVSGPKGRTVTYALLDEGSTISLIDGDLAEEIGVSGPRSALCIQGVGAMETTQQSSQVTVEVRGCDGGSSHDLQLRTVDGLNLRRQRVPRNELELYAHLRDLTTAFYPTANPKILIGADNWQVTLPLEVRVGRPSEPAGVRTELGWAIFGSIPRTSEYRQVHHVTHLDELHELVEAHFKIDALGIKAADNVQREDKRAVDIFNGTVRKIDGPRYEVGQLWASDSPQLPPSYAAAFTRLRGIERKCDRDPAFADQYAAQIDNFVEKGYAEKTEEPIQSDLQWYLPHFAVVNPNKPGKIRLVFDAAAKCAGQSLNDHILEGPDLLQSLLGILIRFREGAVAVTADIKEMFLQVKIRPTDQSSQMFLWRGADRTSPPTAYRMTSMIFGAASSPFLAHSVRNHNAEANGDKYPKAVQEIISNHYMDDFVSSFQTEELAIEVAEEVAASHAEAGFELRAWATNSARLLERVPAELRADEPTQLGPAKEQKILGLIYCSHSDTLGFNTRLIRVPAEVKTEQRAPTKREVLSTVMSVYDPLGLLSHYIVTAKIQLQRLWTAELGWDTALPAEETRRFYEWLRALEHVTELRVPRRYFTRDSRSVSLHIFTDASSQAYAAAAYVRLESPTEVSLIAAKSRVAPKKQLSIPRLELQAALIGARLARAITDSSRLSIASCTLWTDSRTVLQWIRNGERRYSAYVSHRLSEITETTRAEQWRWVPTGLNPADEATRDTKITLVMYNSRWYRGPEFLYGPEQEWPELPSSLPSEPIPETIDARTTYRTSTYHSPLPNIDRFSSYDKLINSTGRVLQFVEQLKTKTRFPLNMKHILSAECLWLQHTQRRDFPEELRSLQRGEPVDRRSKLFELDPVLGDDGVIRLRGRIDAAPVPLNKRPAILDGRSAFVRLLIEKAHRRALHANNERVVNDLKQEYWILRLRTTVRAVVHRCRLCALRRARPQVPPMGDLPLARIEPYTRAFENCGLDYFGPLTVTIGRRHEKRWVALFTCLSTRAVHLETVQSLDTSSAIMALRRMAARRGWPRTMWSDNATCFRGADLELRAAYAEWLPSLRDYGLLQRMSWRFIPPIAPNQGGAWERMVRSVKTALAVTLKSRAPKEEVLATLLAEAEYCVNSRPLTHVSVDRDDPEALTPNHFLLGGPRTVPPTGPCDEADRRTWRAAQALADHFWRRWVREYLPLLAPRRSSPAGERPLAPGDYVIIVDPNLPRNVWPRGLVERVYTGPDGGVRSADVRTRGVVLRRPTTKLAVLPIQPAVADEATAGGDMLRTANERDTTRRPEEGDGAT